MDYLYCVQMYLPLRDKDGQPINTEMFNAMADEIVEKFGGLTMTPFWAILYTMDFGNLQEPKKRQETRIVYSPFLFPKRKEVWSFFVTERRNGRRASIMKSY